MTDDINHSNIVPVLKDKDKDTGFKLGRDGKPSPMKTENSLARSLSTFIDSMSGLSFLGVGKLALALSLSLSLSLYSSKSERATI